MKSYEALQQAINGKTVETAKALGIATVTVNKWQEPHTDYTDSGSYNPLDRIETIIEKSLATANCQDAAYAPIYYLAERFNLVAIPIPGCKCLDDLSKELHASIKEFGHLVSVASEAMGDGRVSKREFERIEEEGQDLIRHTMAFIQKAKELAKGII